MGGAGSTSCRLRGPRNFAQVRGVRARFSAWCWLFGVVLAACDGGEGELTTPQLEAAVAKHRPSLEPCYQRALDEHPYKHEIRIQAVIEIEASGRVARVVLDQGGLAGMGPCLEQTIGSWVFPQAQRPTRTELPLVFKPEIQKQTTR